MRKYSYASRGKRTVNAIDAWEDFTDEELVKILRKALKRAKKHSVHGRFTVYPHMIIVDTWQYES